MPVVDDWEAARRLKGNSQTQNIPIIALSAHVLAGVHEKAIATGCEEFDTKPIEFDRLGAAKTSSTTSTQEFPSYEGSRDPALPPVRAGFSFGG